MQIFPSAQLVARPAALIRDMASFIRHPRVYQGDENTLGAGQRTVRTLRAWALLFSLLLPFMCAIGLVMAAFSAVVQRVTGNAPGEFDAQNVLTDLMTFGSPLLVLFLAVIQAPLLEETAFRLWLKPTRRNLSVGLGAFAFFVFTFVRDLFTTQRGGGEAAISAKSALLALGMAIAFIAVAALILWFVFSGKRLTWVQNFYQRHFWLPYVASSLIFGGIHITNYTNQVFWLAAPILVFPQTLLGFGLGYVRTRFGFGYGILMHMLHNGLMLVPGVLSLQMAKTATPAPAQGALGIILTAFLVAYCGLLFLFVAFNAIWSVAELRNKNASGASAPV
ncbi:MAG: CPBP family glutamic-type intramembrane protease [Anaerolineae bacterium]|nr:CPBP family glutamic-type intramembrane protease [Thermoflexales bacterium]HQW34990.1 CPBP family glutamic-type intramembrane protease [Thermoflexales bacterium]